MAMVNCGECGAAYSDKSKARACVQCGAPVKKKAGTSKWALASLIGVGTMVAVGMAGNAPQTAPVAAPAKSPEAAARETAGLRAAVLAASSIKKSMNDPASFELVEAVLHADGTPCLTYRGKNAFNATITKSAVVEQGKAPALLLETGGSARFVQVWNAVCTKAGGEDITRLVSRNMD